MLEIEFERIFVLIFCGSSYVLHPTVGHVQNPKNVYILRHALPSTTHVFKETGKLFNVKSDLKNIVQNAVHTTYQIPSELVQIFLNLSLAR